MVYFVAVLASILLIFGVFWVLFIRRWGLWFAKYMGTEEKATSFYSSSAGRVALWLIRMSGFLYIFLALFLFVGLLAPALLERTPFYAIAILILLPIIVRLILLPIVSRLVRKQYPNSKID